MGFSIKKPLGGRNSWLRQGGIGMNAGKKDGPANPYAPPDPSSLRSFDVKNPYGQKALSGMPSASRFADFYKSPAERSGGSFDAYRGVIDAPSSVDAVRKETEGERYQAALRDIGRATDQGAGRVVGKYLRSNLYGDGFDSDVARVGIAQAGQQGQEAAAGAALQYRGADLDRLSAREAAQREAYGQKYSADVNTDTQMRQLAAAAAQGDQAAADALAKFKATAQIGLGESEVARKYAGEQDYYNLVAGLYSGGAQRQLSGATPSYLDDMLRNTNISVNPFALAGAG